MKKLLTIFSLFIGLTWGQILNDYKYVIVTVSLPIHYLSDSQNNYGIDKAVTGVLKDKGLQILDSGDNSKWPYEVKVNPCLVVHISVTDHKEPNSWTCGRPKIVIKDCKENIISEKTIKSKNAVCSYPYECCYLRWADASYKHFKAVDYNFNSTIQISLNNIDFNAQKSVEIPTPVVPAVKSTGVSIVSISGFIAVLEFEGNNIPSGEVRALTDRLRSELVTIGQLTIIERGKMDEVLKEQAFQQTGCVSSECAVEVGKLLGVENIITGSISRVGTIYSVSARAFSVASGEIIKTAVYDHSGDIGGLLTQGMKKVAEELGK